MNTQICGDCNGTGLIKTNIGDPHRNEYADAPCITCKGSGRLKFKSYPMQVPFRIFTEKEDAAYYKADTEIWKIIREFELNFKNGSLK